MTIAKAYGPLILSAFNKQVDFDSDTVKCLLTTSAYTPNQDTHQYRSSVTNEVTGTGYTAGGVTLTGKTIAYNASTNTVTLDADNPLWTGVTIAEIRFAVFYVDTGSSATSPLVCYMDFEANLAPTAQNFTVTLASTGIATATVA